MSDKKHRVKIVSMYLPQFHVIPENSEWWGEGFTEWMNTKKAVSYFPGHIQPKTPLHENYYDLSKVETIREQVKWANEYDVDAFAFYHYWFKDGKRVLEKPAELLLANKDINIEMCFSWANENWTKTWHGAKGEKEILMEEEYGGVEEWREHYRYLRDFFMDERYLKKDNMPVFLILNIRDILKRAPKMLERWNDWAKKDGFAGIYFVAMNARRTKEERAIILSNKNIKASVDFVPGRIRDEIRNANDWKRIMKRYINRLLPKVNFWNKTMIESIDYDDFSRKLIARPHAKDEWRNCMVNYDDTPRRGKKGIVTMGSNPKSFYKYFKRMLQKTVDEGKDYMFVTAWNEWGEGNHLEPDEIYEFQWLKAVKKAVKEVCDE